MTFTVIDKKTGVYPDLWKIALKEKWAHGLCYCDMEGFALSEDGTLILMDECGKQAYCPPDRFEILFEDNKASECYKWAHLGGDEWCCPKCGNVVFTEGSWEHPITVGKLFCEHCGAKMEKSV